MNLKLEVGGDLNGVFRLHNSSVRLDPDGFVAIKYDVFGSREPGVYFGNISITGDINAVIPVQITILDPDKIPVQALLINLEVRDRTVNQGAKLQYTVKLDNLIEDQSYPVTVQYFYTNLQNNRTFTTPGDLITLQTTYSLLKSLKIPTNFTVGEYVVTAKADYLGLTSTATALF